MTVLSLSTPRTLTVIPTHDEPDEKTIIIKEKTIQEKITEAAKEAGVNPSLALLIVKNESSFNPKALGDGHLICKQGPNKGKYIQSRGLWQINDCAWPEVTDEQAYDVDWSTAWAIPKVIEMPCIWTAYRNEYPENCP